MPKVEFYYFPFQGWGEQIRMLLAYGGEDWEDIRIPRDDWPKYKHKMPFGQVPVMVVDGKQYAQTMAIARFLGRKHGLAGADLEEDFEIEQSLEFLRDVMGKIKAAFDETKDCDETVKAKKHEDNSKNLFPDLLGRLDKLIRENNGHLALGKLTWPDFVLAGCYKYMKMALADPDLETKYPSFKQLEETVRSLPRVKEYVDAAPKTDF